jgi:transcriptional regulator with XRE-family HTH domain
MTIAQLSAAKAGTTDHRRSEHRRQKVGSSIEVHVALRLKAARLAAGLSQESAAAHINLTFQQLQKYENHKNRISAGKLAVLARIYGKPVSWFFEGAPSLTGPNAPPPMRDLVAEMFTAYHGREVMEDYLALQPDHQMAVASLAAQLAGRTSKRED